MIPQTCVYKCMCLQMYVFTFTLTHLGGMADIPLMEDCCFAAFQILEGARYYLRKSKDRVGRQVPEQCTWRDGSLFLRGIQKPPQPFLLGLKAHKGLFSSQEWKHVLSLLSQTQTCK